MSDYCVLVANATRARLFTLEPAAVPEMESSPRLVEQQMDLVNSEDELAGKDLWSDPKSGRNRSEAAGVAHGYDDHREQHLEQHKQHFARQIAAQAIRHALDNQARYLVIAAEKHMLGLLRNAIEIPAQSGLKIVEVAKDLSKRSPQEIHENLADDQIIPAMKRPRG